MYDLLIIGGGINGVGIAVDAAGRNLSVILCEQNDLAAATSSKSSKLIHGGLRYLENYQFRLVKEALAEREILLKKAPHLIAPLEFILPYNSTLTKPFWQIRLGLFLYDHLSRRHFLSKSSSINFRQHWSGKLLKNDFKKGFVYTDCSVDDARLVIMNAIMARDLGAKISPHTRVVAAERMQDYWKITIESTKDKRQQSIFAKAIVNAGGPWVEQIIHRQFKLLSPQQVELVKGSHIVVPRLYSEHQAFILMNPDHRVIFVIPYQDKFTLIGTTDVKYVGDPSKVSIDATEIDYLCESVNRYFENKIKPADVCWSYAGVRALHHESNTTLSDLSRDYILEVDTQNQSAALLSVFGGKITTYRKLAEHAMQKLQPFFPVMGGDWTATAALPGGDISITEITTFIQHCAQQYQWLQPSIIERYVKSYGTLIHKLLKSCAALSDLGEHFGAGLYAHEIRYLMQEEWASSVEDIIWRRSKLGLELTQEQIKNIEQAMAKFRQD